VGCWENGVTFFFPLSHFYLIVGLKKLGGGFSRIVGNSRRARGFFFFFFLFFWGGEQGTKKKGLKQKNNPGFVFPEPISPRGRGGGTGPGFHSDWCRVSALKIQKRGEGLVVHFKKQKSVRGFCGVSFG